METQEASNMHCGRTRDSNTVMASCSKQQAYTLKQYLLYTFHMGSLIFDPNEEAVPMLIEQTGERGTYEHSCCCVAALERMEQTQ
jgi:hypothetical protein